MENAFLAKMRSLASLPDSDEEWILEHCRSTTIMPSGSEIAAEGSPAEMSWIVLSGLACRYKMLSDGSRQIVAFLVPGDICDPNMTLLSHMDHAIAVNAEAEIASLSRQSVQEIFDTRPALSRAMRLDSLVDSAVLREWLLNNGRREAYPRIAHLLWELYLRHRAVGRVHDHTFELKLTQRDLADATSLSYVHISRTLSRLKREGIIEWTGKVVHFLKADELLEVADFDEAYLHNGRAH